MFGEEGIVIKIEGVYALVKMVQSGSCAQCPSAGLCHQGSDHSRLIKAKNEAGAKVGQRVKVFIAPGSVLAASFFLYILPIFGLLLGAIVGKLLVAPYIPNISSELLSALIGLLTMAGVFWGIRFYGRHYKRNKNFEPKIVEIL